MLSVSQYCNSWRRYCRLEHRRQFRVSYRLSESNMTGSCGGLRPTMNATSTIVWKRRYYSVSLPSWWLFQLQKAVIKSVLSRIIYKISETLSEGVLRGRGLCHLYLRPTYWKSNSLSRVDPMVTDTCQIPSDLAHVKYAWHEQLKCTCAIPHWNCYVTSYSLLVPTNSRKNWVLARHSSSWLRYWVSGSLLVSK